MKANLKLVEGLIYNVRVRGQVRSTRRVFKGKQTRVLRGGRQAFRIPCLVFTSPVPKAMTSVLDPENGVIRFGGLPSGRGYPRSEVSVPHYDLLACAQAERG